MPRRTAKQRARLTLVERFWAKVKVTDGCWLWTGGTNQDGYGVIQSGARGEPLLRASRLSYEIAYGVELTDDEKVLHHCDTPRCVRPCHLFKGDQLTNVRDMHEKERHYKGGPRKLDEGKVREIRRAIAMHIPHATIAKRYRVSLSTIGAISQGRTWRKVA